MSWLRGFLLVAGVICVAIGFGPAYEYGWTGTAFIGFGSMLLAIFAMTPGPT